MTDTNAVSVLEWVERLGGWGVVLLIVRWMMTRIDKMIEGWSAALEQFARFEKSEEELHQRIVSTQYEILKSIEQLRES